MKKAFQLKSLALSMAVAGAASLAMVPAASQAGASANAGVVSSYVWRGMLQTSEQKPMLQGGVDYGMDGGLFVGAWASTLDQGYEYDLYGGWAGTVGEVDLGATYTAFKYTDDSSLDFNEVNLAAGFGPVSVGYDVNTDNSDTVHYLVSADLSSVADGMGLTYGNTTTKGSADTSYFDLGYSTTLDMGIDFSLNVIKTSGSAEDTFLVAGLTKTFE